MKNCFLIIFIVLIACEKRFPKSVPDDEFIKIFDTNSRDSFKYFTPSENELHNFETELKKHLETLTDLNKGYTSSVLDETHPLEYSLGWFKRRYFGRIDDHGNRKIFTELVSVRCGGSEEWIKINYPSDNNSECWWSVVYDIKKKLIENINYP